MSFRNALISLLVIILLISSGCVTTKRSKEETGWLRTKIHDMNARYNGYFNAKELYKASVRQLEETHQDNYNQILDIYPYGTEEDRKSVEENMDIAIEKVVKVAALHEPSKWVDDCYVMMGKAQYLKGDYESAQETFEYFVADFNPRDPDSRVYKAPDRKQNSKEKKKQQAEERKIQQKEREEKREEQKKSRKQRAKEREKERKQAEKERKQRNKDRRKGKKVVTPEKPEETAPPITAEPQPTEVASAGNDVPLDPDEQYLRDLEQKQQDSKDKKIKQGTTGGFMKHKPAYQEGMFWLAKTLIAREKWIEANYFLDKLEQEEELLASVKNELAVVRADYYLQQKDYRKAIPALVEGLEDSKNRTLKARMAFILAQAYQLNGQATEAYAAFDKVKKYKSSFEMVLHAELNKMKNAWASGQSTSDQITKKLNRQAKEDKNRNYQGSIYSTIAEIKLAEGDQEGAMEYFQKALGSEANQGVKTEIYYRLATLFYTREEYVSAKTYYDSTLQVMSEKDPRYRPTEISAKSLNDIAKNIKIIESRDSLLALGNLSQKELEDLARSRVEEMWEAEKEAKEEAGGFTTSTSVFSGNSKFFAYNQIAKQKGRQNFMKRWGDRPLEDDWRRSQKTSSVFDQEELAQEEELDFIPEEYMSREMTKVLRAIPKDENTVKEYNAEIEKAMFELGTSFRTMIYNYRNSNETLLELLERFPETIHRPEALYFIHLNFLDLGQMNMAESFKTRLIRDFPSSDFAIYLNNPSSSKVLITEERKIEMYYDDTYKLFEQGNYQKALIQLEEAKGKFGTSHAMSAKYDLLSAMCMGNLMGKDDYINALRAVVLKYDNTPEQTFAREMMRFLRGDKESFSAKISEEELAKYVNEDSKLHYVIAVIYNAVDEDIDPIKQSINVFNEKNYSAKRLRSTSVPLNREDNSYIVLIRRFNNKDDGMSYYKDVTSRLDEFIDTGQHSYDLYTINQKNYRVMIRDKSTNTYRAFFDNYYLGIN